MENFESSTTTLDRLFAIITERRCADPAESYTASLYAKGLDRILEKLGEEAIETILAAKGQGRERLVHEAADLVFHLLVTLAASDVEWKTIANELERRMAFAVPRAVDDDRRQYLRRAHQRQLQLHINNGLVVSGFSRDVSVNGLLLETEFEPKWQLLGEQGMFELEFQGHVHAFPFVVSRITVYGIGLRIEQNVGMFAYVMSNGALRDHFE